MDTVKREINKGSMIAPAVGILAVAGIFYALWQINPTACAVGLFEIPWLVGIFLGCLALGYVPVRVLAINLSLGQKLVTAVACGTGIYPILVLLFGLAGLLQVRIFWLMLMAGLGIVGAVILVKNLQAVSQQEQIVFEAGKYWRILLIGLIPFIVLTLLCAAIPPGVLWTAEGNGYDVLEYHLQVPKEWFQAGQIHFLAHNAYANFPSNAELFYLLAMAVKGDPFSAVYLAQMIHVGLAVLFVVGVWVFTRRWGLKAACFATVAAGTCPWMVYLAPLAYVEMGMLLAGAVATGLILNLKFNDDVMDRPIRYSVLIGLVLGASAGFKYTALAIIAGPLIVGGFFFFVSKNGLKKAAIAALMMGLVCVLTISPYLVRNLFWTGNPVFPLGYSVMGGKGWDEKMAQRWKAGHAPRADEQAISARLKKLYWAGGRNVISDSVVAESYRSRGQLEQLRELVNPSPIMDLPTFGLAVLVLPWLIFLTRNQRWADWVLLLVFVLQTLVWLFATHLQARFLVPWLIVLPFLVGRSAQAYGRGRFSIGMIVMTLILAGSVVLNLDETYKRYMRHTHVGGEPILWFGQENAFLAGEIPGYEYLKIVNQDPSAKVLLLGEARPFYIRGQALYWTVFNRNEFTEAAAKNIREVKNYISEAKPDFIYVDWSEIIRLSGTYGFDESIKPNLLSNLSSPGRYMVHRAGKWGTFLPYQKWEVPARILYQVTHNANRTEKREVNHGRKISQTAIEKGGTPAGDAGSYR